MSQEKYAEVDSVGRQALQRYCESVSPRPRQSVKRRVWRAAGAFGLASVLCVSGNTFFGNAEAPTAGRGDDRGYEYNVEGDTDQTDSGEGTVAGQPGAPDGTPSVASSITCGIARAVPVEPRNGGTRKVVLDFNTNADTRDPATTILISVAREGQIAVGEGGSVVLNPDGSRVAEVPGNSNAADTYVVNLRAAGVEAPCGGFYFDGPEDPAPSILDDEDRRIPRDS